MAAGTPNGPAGTAALVFSATIIALSGTTITVVWYQ